LRELTRPEEIWVDRYSALHRDYEALKTSLPRQGSML
jgi:hypothetical protein